MNSDKLVTLIRTGALVTRYSLSNVVTPPIGLAYIAGTLKKFAINTNIIDATGEALDVLTPLNYIDGFCIGLTNDKIIEKISDNSDIIGLSCMFSSSWTHDLNLIKKIKSRWPHIKIVLGGEHATACAHYILKNHNEVDICVSGEGENTFFELVTALRNAADLHQVDGITFRKDQQIIQNKRRSRIQDINNIPKPAWEEVPLRNYLDRGIGHGSTNSRSMPLLASRGCPYQCTFCSSNQMWTTEWSVRDVNLVVDEIEEAIKIYHVDNFDLYDLTAIIRKEWIIQFAKEIIARKLKITYQLPSGTRSEAIDSEVCYWLSKSGCKQMNYAPESGSKRTLLQIKKKVSLDNLLTSMRAAINNNIYIMCNIIIFPDCSPKDIIKTFWFMLRASWAGLHDITCVPFVPYPGTEMYEELRAQKRLPPLTEEYFNNLLIHSDLAKANSYNKYFGNKSIIFIRLLFLGTFYLSSFIFRPVRIYKTIRNVLKNSPQTRGESGLIILFSKLFKSIQN